jgi:hypothetical protein
MRIRLAAAFAVLVSSLVAASHPGVETPGTVKADDGWIDLMKPDVWKKYDPAWVVTDEVKLDPEKDTTLKAEKQEGGKAWVNGPKGRLPNLITKEAYGDCEIHVEFLIAKKSNAGVKFHEVYEIQILDSFGKKDLDGTGMGGIYPRADSKGYLDKGIGPKVNAAKPAGEWNTLDVVWKSPRFDAKGEKTANAMVVKATLNGQVIHENQELKTPTGGNWMKKEVATGSFMLQSDHGPTAWRNVKIKPVK